MVVPRAAKSCPGDLDSLPQCLMPRKSQKTNSVQAVINCIFLICLEQSTKHLRSDLWKHGMIPTVMDSAKANSRTKKGRPNAISGKSGHKHLILGI